MWKIGMCVAVACSATVAPCQRGGHELDRLLEILEREANAVPGVLVVHEPEVVQRIDRERGAGAAPELQAASRRLQAMLGILRGQDPDAALAALDAATRTTMEVRRRIAARQDAARENGDAASAGSEAAPGRGVAFNSDFQVDVRVGGNVLAYLIPEQSAVRTANPQARAQQELERAVVSLDQAAGRQDARAALDRVDAAIATLRALLWEAKARRG